jgi:uncharacterized protein YndB with AHSA1/START domain
MSDDYPIECTLVLRRIYNAPVARVWSAWTDPAQLGLWYVAGDDHIIHFCEADVRVGGTYRVGFGRPGTTPYVETGRYTEIVALKRLAFEEVVTLDDNIMGGSANVIDFKDLGDGRTQLILSCTGEDSWRSGEGWTPCLRSLAAYLASSS